MEQFHESSVFIPETIGKYRVIKKIGRGGTSIVVMAQNVQSKEYYAIKIVSRKSLNEKCFLLSFEQELRIHEQLNHPNIVKLIEIIYDDINIYSVMELCINGELFDWITSGTFNNVGLLRSKIFQILKAVQYLHSRNIAHMDIKPENILIDSLFKVKLTDFGCCITTVPKIGCDILSTLFYTAPEILTHDQNNLIKADIWSLGIVFYVMATGYLPWTSSDKNKIKEQIIRNKITIPDEIPILLAQIIKQCLCPNPANRPSVDELLMSPFFMNERAAIDQHTGLKKRTTGLKRQSLLIPRAPAFRSVLLKPQRPKSFVMPKIGQQTLQKRNCR